VERARIKRFILHKYTKERLAPSRREFKPKAKHQAIANFVPQQVEQPLL
jgi:hypothetical protein